MDERLALVAALVDLATARGLEIGPLDRPLVTRATGPVEYADRDTREGLRAAYTGHDVDLDRIPDIDHVWGARTLAECVGENRFGYVLASHVIEHVPDVYGWLAEIAGILHAGGQLILFAPDKRRTFDARRPPSTGGEFVEAWLRHDRRPGARQIFNHIYDTRELDAAPLDEAALTERARQALDIARRSAATGEYVDVHAWVFTPRSLVTALDLASRLDLLPFEVVAVRERPDEFLAALRRLPDNLTPEARRAAFLASIQALALPEDDEEGETALLRAQAERAQARLRAIEGSTIWRASAPLRRLLEGLRRRR